MTIAKKTTMMVKILNAFDTFLALQYDTIRIEQILSQNKCSNDIRIFESYAATSSVVVCADDASTVAAVDCGLVL